jgi:endothelin-converting enzyme
MMKDIQKTVFVAGFMLKSVLGVWTAPPSTLKHFHNPVTLGRRHGPAPGSAQEVCTTAKCKDYATFILESLAPNYTAIDPCTDFDRYSCDGWRNTHNYRADQASLSVTTNMSDVNQALLHSILEGPYSENPDYVGTNKTFDLANFNKMKTTYNTCKNEDAIKTYGIKPVLSFVEELQTVYPLKAPATVSSKDELTKTMIWLFKKNVAVLVSSSVGVSNRRTFNTHSERTNNTQVDDMNPDTTILNLGASEFQLAKEYYKKPAVLTNYTRALAQTLQVISSGKPYDEEPIPATKNASLFEKAQRIVDFEKKVALVTPEPDQASDVKVRFGVQSKTVILNYHLHPLQYYYNIKTLGDLESIAPEISLVEYLKSLVPPAYSIDSKRGVMMTDINYYKNLSSIIQSTPRETLHDYFEWRLISTWVDRLHKNYSAPLRRFNNIMVGREPDVLADRWRICVSEVDHSLGHLLSNSFIGRAFTKKDKQLGDQIITDIKNMFADNLKTLDWMSAASKEIAAKKGIHRP